MAIHHKTSVFCMAVTIYGTADSPIPQDIPMPIPNSYKFFFIVEYPIQWFVTDCHHIHDWIIWGCGLPYVGIIGVTLILTLLHPITLMWHCWLISASCKTCHTSLITPMPSSTSELIKPHVKNRFSNPTKEQIGWYWCRKDVTNDHQEKALKEGCHEREQAQMDVCSTEKTNTKEHLARVMTKSKSKTQTVANGCVSWEAINRVSNKCPNVKELIEWEVQSPQGDIQEGQRFMIIEMEIYNEIGELLIENRATGHRDTYAIGMGAREYL